MIVDAGKVLDTLEPRELSGWRRVLWVAANSAAACLLWPWPWLTRPWAKYITATSLAAPCLTGRESHWYWAFGLSVTHVVFSDLVGWARRRNRSAGALEGVACLRVEIERALTVIKRRVATNAPIRLTVLLPRNVRDGEWKLVPALRSDGIPVKNSRCLRVVANKRDESEGIAGLMFQQDLDYLERACEHGSGDYEQQMHISREFLRGANDDSGSRRNPCYVLALMLRFNGVRLGVLAIDSEESMNLAGNDDRRHWSDLNSRHKGLHTQRRKIFEAVADVMPRLSIARLFTSCGVTP